MEIVTYQGDMPQLMRQRCQKLPFVRIVAVRGLKASLVNDNAVAGTVALPEGVACLLLVELVQVEHIARTFACRQIHSSRSDFTPKFSSFG